MPGPWRLLTVAVRWALPPQLHDLGLDSVDFWTVLMDVEDQVGANVPSEVFDALAQLDKTPTVADILDAVAMWTAVRAKG